ncbi:MAG: 30S ribosomal protein S6 [Candidatus Colwellbacteria bacterium]|nr:30S ribosomal protein S6 [Candidatus Colwellbacteria bacterium]
MSEGKKHYEISFLARNEGDKDLVTKALADIGAEITNQGRYSEIRLAYPVKKQTVAYFGFYDFMAEADKIAVLEGVLRYSEAILRSLIITPPPRKPAPRAERRPVEGSSAAPAEIEAPEANEEIEAPEPVAEKSEEPEVNEELLDQKLNEIIK